MRIDKRVFEVLDAFYDASMSLHESLSYEAILAKEQRMITDLKSLMHCAVAMPEVRFKKEWKDKRYHDFHTEGVHFAFRIETLPNGEQVVVVYDACPDLLYYD